MVDGLPRGQAAAPTHYQGRTPDGKRPGRVSVAVSDPTHRGFINDEAVAYYEGVPGHHLQITIQQSLTGLPSSASTAETRRIPKAGAYAKELGKEIGFYQDPGSGVHYAVFPCYFARWVGTPTGKHNSRLSLPIRCRLGLGKSFLKRKEERA